MVSMVGVPSGKTQSSIVAICSADDPPLQEGNFLKGGVFS